MACQDNYIGKNHSDESRSRLYVSDLPGVDDLQFDLLSKNSETVDDVWERISRNSWNGLNSDIEAFLNEKMFVNKKLLSRETSEFKTDVNSGSSFAGIRIKFDLSRYSKIHIVSIEVWSNQDYASPEAIFYFYDENDNLLHEVSSSLVEGRNTIFVDHDFESDTVFVAYDPTLIELRQTQNRKYDFNYSFWSVLDCMFPSFGGHGSFTQIENGGINVVYNVFCSVEKFVCQNINLFRTAFWWRYGVELANERRIGNRLNQYTTMIQERKDELFAFYTGNYQQALSNALKAQNIYEDWVCFECKGSVSTKTILP